MVGVLFVGVFVAVGLAYACSEYVMTRLDVRRRVMVGQSGLPLILGVNLISLAFLWVCAEIGRAHV